MMDYCGERGTKIEEIFHTHWELTPFFPRISFLSLSLVFDLLFQKNELGSISFFPLPLSLEYENVFPVSQAIYRLLVFQSMSFCIFKIDPKTFDTVTITPTLV